MFSNEEDKYILKWKIRDEVVGENFTKVKMEATLEQKS